MIQNKNIRSKLTSIAERKSTTDGYAQNYVTLMRQRTDEQPIAMLLQLLQLILFSLLLPSLVPLVPSLHSSKLT